jgi:hypothetical protein
MDVGRSWEWRTADLAPSHFSFPGFEPDEKSDILYPRWELDFSDRAEGERAWAGENETERRTEDDRRVWFVETGEIPEVGRLTKLVA